MGSYVGTTTSYLLETPNVSPAVQKYVSWAKAQEGDPGRTPALDLNFAENKSLVDDISGSNLVTFTRTSAATYVDGSGVIKTTPVNLYTYSKDFSSGWTTNQITLSTNQGLAPDGTNTAALVTTNTVASYNTLSKEPVLNTSTDYCYSVFVKLVSGSGTSSRAVLASANNLISPVYASYGLQLDTVSDTSDGNTPTTKGYVAYPNGWYRIYMVINTSAQTNPAVSIRFGTGNADSVATFYVWGAQVEEGTSPSEYIPTTSTISGAPRFDHDPVTGESLGLLIEESRTNLILYSNDFSQSNWIKQNSHPTPSKNAIGPDGVANSASTVYRTATNQYLYQSISGGGTYTLSAWVKSEAATGSFTMQGYNGTDGTMAESFTATNEWQRFETTISPTTNTNYYPCIPTNTNTNFYVWGVQVESGSFKTSYIPTSSSTVTRSVDSALLSTSNWWDYTKGTAYAEYRGGLESNQSGYGRVWSPFTVATFIAGQASHVYNNRHAVWFGGTAIQLVGQEHLSSFAKNAITYSNNGTNCDIVSASYPSSTTGTTNSSVDSASHGIGRNVSATTNMLNGHIKRMTYWEQVLDPSTLQSLTE